MQTSGLSNQLVTTLMSLSDEEKQALRHAGGKLEEHLDTILDKFYAIIGNVPELSGMFETPMHIQHARAAQRAHWLCLFSGLFDTEYQDSVRKIGLAHHRIGLEPQIYMAGYSIVLTEIQSLILHKCASKVMYKNSHFSHVEIELAAITKAIIFDMQLSITVYLEEQNKTKAQALRAMADKVEQDAGAAVDDLAKSTTDMADNAQQMANSALAVSDNSKNVATAALHALSNAQAVSTATEELCASIQEISGQIGSVAQATVTAVDTADECRHAITRLSNAVGQIGDVANLISQIASQTNLLALNATIEAARAGDAGKGFAVVANEVKNLAAQTARATSEITKQINTIRTTTTDAVDTVTKIVQSIENICHISSSVAAEIEEQSVATREIARNVSQTTDATQEVTIRIEQISREASGSGDRAADVSRISSEIALSIEEFREIMIKALRTAAPEADRRDEPRIPISLTADVTYDGNKANGTVVDISSKGIQIANLPDITTGLSCVVSVHGIQIEATSRKTKNGVAHFKFTDTVQAQSRIEAWLKHNSVIAA